MTYQHLFATLCLTAATTAFAQSATVTLAPSTNTPAPGDTVTVTLDVGHSTGGAPSGSFGSPGLYGFGGDITASGDAGLLAQITASAPSTNALLTFGQFSSVTTAPGIVRAAAGRGLNGGLGNTPLTLLTFDLTIDPAATPGSSVTLDFDGTVVLAAGDLLLSISTDPGVNQLALTTAPVTLTVSAPCQADLNADGVLDNGDIGTFVSFFLGGDLAAYFNGDGILDNGDIGAFVAAFLAGC